MVKVTREEMANEKTLSKAKKFLKGLGISFLACLTIVGSGVTAKAATAEPQYLFVKQPEIVDNYYYQWHWNDFNRDGLMEQREIQCLTYYIADPNVVLPQTNANVFGVSSEPVIYGWANLGEYAPEYGICPTVEDAKSMLVNKQIDDGEQYVMRKLPEMTNNGKEVRWYYWRDYDGDGYTDNSELVYYDEAVDSRTGIVPAQPQANVYAVSDTMFKDGWEVTGIYDSELDKDLRDIDRVDKQIDKNEKKSSYELKYLPPYYYGY